jgi:LytS/YehU family sensor histidine kinase
VVERVLLALPALGFAAGVALGAAAVLMLVRALLGAEVLLVVIAFGVYAGMLVWAGRTVSRSARTLFNHATQQSAAAADARATATAAQLAALQARMNPHFLFNALNTVASLVRSKSPSAERVVENLSDVLRRTLGAIRRHDGHRRGRAGDVRAYLALEQERWGDRLRVEWNVADDALACRCRRSSFSRSSRMRSATGLDRVSDGGTIRITVRAGSEVLIRVDDDGAGFPPRWKEGTGLGNLRQRLQTQHGSAATLQVASDAEGTHVTVSIPLVD